MGIKDAKFMKMKPYSSHFIVALLPTYFAFTQLHKRNNNV
jgi:hypothetical protein